MYELLNPVFDFYHQTGEQDFYRDFVDEEIRLAGVEALFVPRDVMSVDSILKEPYQSLFSRFYPIPMRISNPQVFGGDGEIMSQFGMRIVTTAEWVISKRMFRDLKIPGREIRPLEGDLLMIGPSNGNQSNRDPQYTYELYEINYVRHNFPNWTFGDYFVYQLVTQLYVAGSDKFDTKTVDIDRTKNEDDNQSNLSIASNFDLDEKKKTLVDFSEKNPFSGM